MQPLIPNFSGQWIPAVSIRDAHNWYSGYTCSAAHWRMNRIIEQRDPEHGAAQVCCMILADVPSLRSCLQCATCRVHCHTVIGTWCQAASNCRRFFLAVIGLQTLGCMCCGLLIERSCGLSTVTTRPACLMHPSKRPSGICSLSLHWVIASM
jgi:hypothetical protein